METDKVDAVNAADTGATPPSSGAGGRSGKRGHNAAGLVRRDAILDAALVEFSHSGFGGTSMREIARRCGISHAALTYHFHSKAELLVAVLERRDRRIDGPLGTLRTDDNSVTWTDGEDSLEVILRIIRADMETPGISRLYSVMQGAATNHDHPAHEFFANRLQSLYQLAADAVCDEQRRGRLSPDLDAEKIAMIVLGLWDGLQTHAQIEPDEVDVEELAKYLASLLFVSGDSASEGAADGSDVPDEGLAQSTSSAGE